MNKLAENRRAILEMNYQTKDPLEVKEIQLNQLIILLDDLKYQSKEAIEVALSLKEAKECETAEEVINKSQKLIKAVRGIITGLETQLEDLTEE